MGGLFIATSSSMNISVIIPTHNRAYSLSRALDSVFSQSTLPDEVIVVDDGSNDGTSELIEHKYPLVKTIYQNQQGVSAARNVGIGEAKFDWIAFLDSDDEWLPHKLEKQCETLMASPGLQVCHTEEIWIRNGERVNQMNKHKKTGGWIYQNCLPLCAMSPSSIMIHKCIFADVGLFKEQLPACEDYDLWLRICARYPVLYVEKPCINKYGGHEDQLSSAYWGMDRFRIQALMDILKEQVLNEDDKGATKIVLRKKIEVYSNGARKRGKDDELHYYQNLLEEVGAL